MREVKDEEVRSSNPFYGRDTEDPDFIRTTFTGGMEMIQTQGGACIVGEADGIRISRKND
ncbi:hypothetical protein [Candidatus Absconditicoccus praedator]|uniref:hypothetical protein n=1 Tax=Candidatus Absconditicoccus praedator TaxID=2735562 RepID=UPI001E3E4C04|nr:hypothetical protein [Candidatus Absconditicoccus praedator]UFX82992.1 hypothetical protein HLG78_02555 [Candidatus Absconditicoccus praedator]